MQGIRVNQLLRPTLEHSGFLSQKKTKFGGNRDRIYGVAVTDKVSRVLLHAGRHTVRPRFRFLSEGEERFSVINGLCEDRDCRDFRDFRKDKIPKNGPSAGQIRWMR